MIIGLSISASGSASIGSSISASVSASIGSSISASVSMSIGTSIGASISAFPSLCCLIWCSALWGATLTAGTSIVVSTCTFGPLVC